MAESLLGKRTFINIGLAGIAVIVATVLWQNPGDESGSSQTVSGLDKNDIKKIKIKTNGRPDIELHKKETAWEIIAPFQVAANTFRVNSVLNLLSAPSLSQYDVSGKNLTEFGLEPPQAVVDFDQNQFLFGDTAPLNNKRYLLSGATLHLIEDTIYPLITSDIGSLVDSGLLPDQSSVTRFTLNNFSVVKQESGWRIEPDIPHLSADDLQGWVDRWRNAQAVYIEHRPLEMPDTRQHIILTLEDGNRIRYSVTDKEGIAALYRGDLGLKYNLSETVLAEMLAMPEPAVVENTEDKTDQAVTE